MVGLFVNLLLLRIAYGTSPTFASLLAVVREVAIQAFANQDAPFDEVVRVLSPRRRSDVMAFGEIAFVQQNVPSWRSHCLPELRWELLDNLERQYIPHDLHVIVDGNDRDLTCYFAYASDRFRHSTATAMLEGFCDVLHIATIEPDFRL